MVGQRLDLAGNITADDTSYALITAATYDSPDQSYLLLAKGFDFSSIPDGSTINGITVVVRAWYANGTNSGDHIRLLDTAGAAAGTNKWSTPQALTTSQANYTLGGASDLWGNSLTAAWVKDADFGVALGFAATGANSDVFVDFVTIDIDYTAPAPPVELVGAATAGATASGVASVTKPMSGAATAGGLAAGALAVAKPLAGAATAGADTAAKLRVLDPGAWFPRLTDTAPTWAPRLTAPAVELVGAATASTSAEGELDHVVPLEGAAVVSGAAAAALSVGIPLEGAATAGTTASGTVTVTKPVAGAAAASGQASGALSLTLPLSATALGVASADGVLSLTVPLSGAALTAAGASGTLSLVIPLAGAGAAAGLASGALTVEGTGQPVELAGGAIISAQAAAALTQGIPLAGDALAAVLAAAGLTQGVPLAGGGSVSATAGGALAVTVPLSGAAQAALAAAADLSQAVHMLGAAFGAAQASAELAVGVALDGAASVRITADGELSLTIPLAGAAFASAVAAAGLDGVVTPPAPPVEPEPRALRSHTLTLVPPRTLYAHVDAEEDPDRFTGRARVIAAEDWNDTTDRHHRRARARACIAERSDSMRGVAAIGGFAGLLHVQDDADCSELVARVNDDELIAESMADVFKLFRMAG